MPPQKKFNFRRFLYKLESTFEKASHFADIFHKCTKEPSVFNIAKTAFDVANEVQQMFLINYYEFFCGWSSPYSDDYNYAIIEILKHLPYTEAATSDPHLSLRKVVINLANGKSFELYYCVNIEHESIEGIHVRNENIEHARDFIKQSFWTEFGGQFLLMHKRRVFDHGREVGEFLVFDTDDEVEPHMSARSRIIAQKTKRFLDNKISRSILLYGPPGTGKSTMVRAIVRDLELSSLRIRVEDLEDMTNTTIFEAIKIFEPECIIIDDLDRVNRLSHLLEMLERFNKKLKVVFATVNDKDSLGEAILRPGRFDELIEVKEMDDETLRRILGTESPEVIEVLKTWPVAYILEYTKRRTYMSREDALLDLGELRSRVMQLEGYTDKSAESEVQLKKLTKKNAFKDAAGIKKAKSTKQMTSEPTKREVKLMKNKIKAIGVRRKRSTSGFVVANLIAKEKALEKLVDEIDDGKIIDSVETKS